MAIIAQGSLFSWEEVETLGDLERFRLVLEHLPDEMTRALAHRAEAGRTCERAARGQEEGSIRDDVDQVLLIHEPLDHG